MAASIPVPACVILNTLGWRWGPAHIEVKRTSRGPVLVEVNAGRFNGGLRRGH